MQLNGFNSNSSIWFCHFSLFINACRSLSSFFFVVVLLVAVPIVLPFSVAFHHSSVDGPSELLTFVQLFSGSRPLLDYRNFCNIQIKLTKNFYVEEERADTKKKPHSNYGFFSIRNQKGEGQQNTKNLVKIYPFFSF